MTEADLTEGKLSVTYFYMYSLVFPLKQQKSQEQQFDTIDGLYIMLR